MSERKFNLSEAMTPRVRRRILIEERGYKCEICGISEWMNKPITIELDHIDGNHQINTDENLRLLCPNCHSQTPTFRSKNRGNGRHLRIERRNSGKSF